MDPSTFQALLGQLERESFSDGKKSAIRSYLQYYFSGQQVAEVIRKFNFPSDQTEALEMIGPRMCGITGYEGKAIVECFTHADDKVKAVEVIACHIHDPVNKYVVLDAISFHFDKEKCRTILDKAVFVGGGPTPQAPCSTVHTHTNLPQPGAPTGISVNIGNDMGMGMGMSFNVQPTFGGVPATQPGSANYGQGNYPPQQGGYPPPQGAYQPPGGHPPQGSYPPQQGSYPPQQGGYPPQGNYPPQQGGYPPPGGYPPSGPPGGTYPPGSGYRFP